jgi:predicted RNA-binding protein associated with RNAse of E/G family
MTAITVYKLNHLGREVWQYPARVLERDASSIRLEAFFNRDDMDLGYAVFKRGDRFIEYFYTDRWYNLFAVYDRDDGALKGWYANIGRPAQIEEKVVRCEDLALDLWIAPDGSARLLDEEEYAALPLSPDERQQADAAVHALQTMAWQGTLPR